MKRSLETRFTVAGAAVVVMLAVPALAAARIPEPPPWQHCQHETRLAPAHSEPCFSHKLQRRRPH
jgi:hypothetical protein